MPRLNTPPAGILSNLNARRHDCRFVNPELAESLLVRQRLARRRHAVAGHAYRRGSATVANGYTSQDSLQFDEAMSQQPQ